MFFLRICRVEDYWDYFGAQSEDVLQRDVGRLIGRGALAAPRNRAPSWQQGRRQWGKGWQRDDAQQDRWQQDRWQRDRWQQERWQQERWQRDDRNDAQHYVPLAAG